MGGCFVVERTVVLFVFSDFFLGVFNSSSFESGQNNGENPVMVRIIKSFFIVNLQCGDL